MIISASRRTDIPAFYSRWFVNRIRAGYCVVPNPYNPRQVSAISLTPQDVDVIVFWTRHAGPLLPMLGELDQRGYRYLFQYTLLDYPRWLDRRTPSLAVAVSTFTRLADQIGPERIVWRYDPIVSSRATGEAFHAERFAAIARALQGRTHRVVISLMDLYRKAEKRMRESGEQGEEIVLRLQRPTTDLVHLVPALVQAANENGMIITSCAEQVDLRPYGVEPGKCIDDDWIRQALGLTVSGRKDPAQREACGCVVSRDIGMYDSCLFGCGYCYATGSLERARRNWRKHDPESASMLGHHGITHPHQGQIQGTLPLIP